MWSSQDSVDTPLCVLRTGFERFWTDASQVAMASDRIVERSDVIGHVRSCQLSVLVDPPFDPLFLQARKEGFSDCVVPAVSASAHAGLKSIRSAEASPVIATILASLIRVDHSVSRTPAPHSHHYGIQHELPAQARPCGPTNDQP